MEMLHLLNSTGLIIAAAVVLMALTGEVGMTISELLAGEKPQRG